MLNFSNNRIKEKLSFIPSGTNHNFMNNLMSEAVRRGIDVKVRVFENKNKNKTVFNSKTITLNNNT